MFRNRSEAGQRLAAALDTYRATDTVVLGLPRGGVVVAYEVAAALGVPLDVLLTRKVGAPFNPEYAIGAVSEAAEPALNHAEVAALGIPATYLESEIARQRAEIERQARLYRGGRAPLPVEGKTAIVVDDGIATGFTMFASVRALRMRGPAAIVVAVPVAPPSTAEALATEVERLICLFRPEPFFAVGSWYEDFEQVSDDTVQRLLAAASVRRATGDADTK